MSGPESTKTQLSTDQSRDACRVYFIQQCHSLACSGHKTDIKTGLEQCFEHRSKPKALIELIFPVWREISGSMSRTARKRPKLSFDQKQKLWPQENPQRPPRFKEKIPRCSEFLYLVCILRDAQLCDFAGFQMRGTVRKIPKLSFDQKQKFWASENPQRSLSFKGKNPDALSFSISAAFCVARIRTRIMENGLISSRSIGPNA